jgi:hypothetical protein
MACSVLFVGFAREAPVEAQAPGRPVSPVAATASSIQSTRMPGRHGGTPTAGRCTASSGGIT